MEKNMDKKQTITSVKYSYSKNSKTAQEALQKYLLLIHKNVE